MIHACLEGDLHRLVREDHALGLETRNSGPYGLQPWRPHGPPPITAFTSPARPTPAPGGGEFGGNVVGGVLGPSLEWLTNLVGTCLSTPQILVLWAQRAPDPCSMVEPHSKRNKLKNAACDRKIARL